MFFLFWPVFDPELVLCLISGKTLIWKITMYDVNHPEGDSSACVMLRVVLKVCVVRT